jgi:EPS-associated MarR family transcriptional regulator
MKIVLLAVYLKSIKAKFFFTVHVMNDIVQRMNNFNKNSEDHFKILRKIQKSPERSQREMASELGFSLGKLNYCLKALRHKGLIKIRNFKNNPNKLNYFYVLTPKGISEKTKLTLNFMKRKFKEYEELKKELK